MEPLLLMKRYEYGEKFYLASQILSDQSEEDILRKLSLLYHSQIYETIVEQDLTMYSPEDIVALYKEEKGEIDERRFRFVKN